MDETVVPTHSRRNAADRRNGPVSASTRNRRGTTQHYLAGPASGANRLLRAAGRVAQVTGFQAAKDGG
jgi:hypothetical protein